MRVAVFGAGFVGLTTALGLCSKGHSATCVDISAERVEMLNRGQIPFHEPGLPALLADAISHKRFMATTEAAVALQDSQLSLICVGTPSTAAGIDLRYVQQVATTIGTWLKSQEAFHVVTVKSTVVPGTTDTAVRLALEHAAGKQVGTAFGLAMNPEFLREGCAVDDFLNPDRIVVGADDTRSHAMLAELYSGFDCPLLPMTTRNAEMTKYAANALLATLISYANEITTLCEAVPGLDEGQVMGGVFEDKRFWCQGANGERLKPGALSYLRGGIGFGGSCFPKDVTALHRYAKQAGLKAPLLEAVLAVNESRAAAVVHNLKAAVGGSLQGKRIALLGLAFKPDTDDLRESPALKLLQALKADGATVVAQDPIVTAGQLEAFMGEATPVTQRMEDALAHADAAVIATAWPEYGQADWAALGKTMAAPLVFDGRQTLTPTAQAAVTYRTTGRRAV